MFLSCSRCHSLALAGTCLPPKNSISSRCQSRSELRGRAGWSLPPRRESWPRMPGFGRWPNPFRTKSTALAASAWPPERRPAAAGDIELKFDPALHDEQYALDVGDRAVCRGGTYMAAAWSTVTLLQALNSRTAGHIAAENGRERPARFPLSQRDDRYRPQMAPAGEPLRAWSISSASTRSATCSSTLNDHGMFTFGSKQFPKLPTVGKYGRRYYTIEELKALVAYATRAA